MKKYYGVITTYDDHGKVTAHLIDVKESDKKPADTFISIHAPLARCDSNTIIHG